MTVWDDTLAAALLGTARRPPPGHGGEERGDGDAGRIGVVLAGAAEGRAAEAALLASAGTLAVVRRAGLRPPTPDAGPAAERAPDDPRPPAPPVAAAHLAALLAAEAPREALPEWLQVAAAKGVRPPAELLPDLLDVAVRADPGSPERTDALAVAGPRGAWLAATAGAWPDLAAAAPPGQDGNDADALRAHVEERWEDESPQGRVALLDALAPTLGPADEPLLERARADRRKPVRLRAAELLSALPDSAYAQRLAALAEPVLTLHGGLRGQRIEVEPPAELDPKLALDVKRPTGRGERAHLLIQLLSAAPLRAWTDRFGLTPDELVRTRLPKEWRDDVLRGWTTAARRQGEVEWARALVAHAPHLTASLATMLPREEAERAIVQRVRDGDLRDLPLHTGGWGPALSRELAKRMDRVTEQELVRPVAAALHPSAFEEAERGLQRIAERGSWTGRGAVRGLELITFRRAMLAALNEEPEG